MTKHTLKIGDEFEWSGHRAKIAKVLHIGIALDGVGEVICVPVTATGVEVFTDTPNEEGGGESWKRLGDVAERVVSNIKGENS
jgi:hypothetical protein